MTTGTVPRTSTHSVTLLPQVDGRSPLHLNDVLIITTQREDVNGGRTAVYFGADVQNFQVEMESHRDHRRYVEWSLENTGKLLLNQLKSKYSKVLVIKPSRMERLTFSCYDNFVESNACGVPTHDDIHVNALVQLKCLLRNVAKTVALDGNLTLIGFSKGVVVLNQILHEIHTLCHGGKIVPSLSEMKDFSESIDLMVWLDGGHNGAKETWIVSETILKTLVEKTKIKVDVRVTPYQTKNPRRPWIGREEKRFEQLLQKKLKMAENRFRSKVYFEDEEPSLENHFRILETFESDLLA